MVMPLGTTQLPGSLGPVEKKKAVLLLEVGASTFWLSGHLFK